MQQPIWDTIPTQDQQLLLAKDDEFQLRSYNKYILPCSSAFFFITAIGTAVLFFHEGNLRAAVFSLLTWSAFAILILALNMGTRQKFMVTKDYIAHIGRSGRIANQLDWHKITCVDYTVITELQYIIQVTLKGERGKIEVDSLTPRFGNLAMLITLHLFHAGKLQEAKKLNDLLFRGNT